MTGERVIAVLLLSAIASAVGLAVVYVTGGQPQLEGALLAVSLGGIGAAVIVWVKELFPDEEVIAERPALSSSQAERDEFVRSLAHGERAFGRRRFLSALLGGAVAAFGAALLFPIRSLGPTPGRALFRTAWTAGSRLVGIDGQPVRADELQVGSAVTVFPEGHRGREDSATMLVRVADGGTDGHLAYSKVCTHVGCPVGLYREATHELICPCHQSTFDVLDGARPTFGPATRPLPQLPIEVDDEGYLVARSDFTEPVGPAFWNRAR